MTSELEWNELRARGRVRDSYAGSTLRGNLQDEGPRLRHDHPGFHYRR